MVFLFKHESTRQPHWQASSCCCWPFCCLNQWLKNLVISCFGRVQWRWFFFVLVWDLKWLPSPRKRGYACKNVNAEPKPGLPVEELEPTGAPPRPVSTVWAESRAVSRPQARSQQLNTAGGGWPRLGETRSLSGGGELCCSALQRLLPFQKEQRAGVLRQEWAKESDQLLKNSDPPLHTCRHLGPGNLYFISSTQVILMHLCQEPQCKDPWLARSIYD